MALSTITVSTPFERLQAAAELADRARERAEDGDYAAAAALAQAATALATVAHVQATAGIDHVPSVPPQPRPPLPPWCGQCDGAELAARWIQVSDRAVPDAVRLTRCPRCNPHAPIKDEDEAALV
jgi:hypothetical protein